MDRGEILSLHTLTCCSPQFRTPAEATAALELSGVEFGDGELQFKRPSEYLGIDPQLGGGESNDSPDKLYVGGLPENLNEEQVQELLKSFGELKHFSLLKEDVEGKMVSRGIAFCEYQDSSVTDMAIKGLHNFDIGEHTLTVERAIHSRPAEASGLPGTSNFLTQRK